jgi:para-nitrobenzyl esterase
LDSFTGTSLRSCEATAGKEAFLASVGPRRQEASILKLRLMITWFTRNAIAVAIAFLTVPPVTASATDAPKVLTADGPIQGFYTGNVAEFLGIPYAAPPIRDLRWRPPQPVAKWSETLLTIGFGNTCVQNQSGKFAHPSITEDCLYLNVYTPRDYETVKQRPVLVWLYGGGLVAGETNDYDGSKLADKGGTVVVTVNYRVGLLGFFAHPALDSEQHNVGNYGLMDQQFALKWVQANIANFGGDPNDVTIFGQSGGATAVMANLVSPTAAGLFQKIINESGTHIVATPLAEAEKMGERFATKAGCTEDVAACLRALSPAAIVTLGPPPASFYILDGTIITLAPYESFEKGQFNRVPILTGLTADEQAFFLPELQGGRPTPLSAAEFNAFVASFGDEWSNAILADYPLSSYASPSLAEIAVAQGSKACTARRFDQLWSQFVPVYAYQFDDETAPNYLPQASYPTRAFHTAELLYLFPLFRGGQGTPHPLNEAQERLSDQLVSWWTDFARTGNPNASSDSKPLWEKYSAADDNVLMITQAASHMTAGYGAQTYPENLKNDCALWDKINTYE